ncbi:MAG: hypothetical protein DRI79_12505 [Chloroflexi bacterium]|nr:MAG: hypothetical protein DRI80_11765 [Chloroflexota bacterium]RLC84687.1 MAG: hypothetical protein DRI79_12505 [Chloroflexota bacterium]HEY67041.1 hypothetical protein [Thermoflexia bacterium]
MSRLIKQWIPVLIAAITGLVVLAGYLIPSPLLIYYRDRLIEWAVIVAAFAFILGLFNILRVHGGRVVRLRQGWFYSLILLLVAMVAWVPPVLYGPSGTPTRQMLDYVIGPLGASLAALVVFTLALAAFRLLRVRRSAGAVFFILVVAVVLLGSTPLMGLEWLADVRDWIISVPGMAGMRGLLLGVALGTVITALRVFVASDRPHSEF